MINYFEKKKKKHTNTPEINDFCFSSSHFVWILWTAWPWTIATMINDVYIIFYLSYAISRIMFLLWRWLVWPILSLSTVRFDVLPQFHARSLGARNDFSLFTILIGRCTIITFLYFSISQSKNQEKRIKSFKMPHLLQLCRLIFQFQSFFTNNIYAIDRFFLFIFLTEYTLCLCLRNRIDVTVLGANDMRKKNHFSQNLQRNKNVFNLYSILKSWFAMHSPWMILQLISLNLMPNCIIWFLKGDELLTDYSNWNLKWNLETIIEQSLDIANGNKRSEVDTCCCFSCKYKWPLDGTNE